MASGLVAGEHIEFVDDDGKTGRIAPGEELPSGIKADDIKALREGGAIMTAKDYTDREATRAVDANRERIRAQAAAAGLIVRSSDSGSGSDRKG